MGGAQGRFAGFRKAIFFVFRDGGVDEAVSDVGGRLGGRVDEVLGVETVVAELVEKDLERGEITDPVRVTAAERVGGEDEGRLGDGIALRAVGKVAARAHGEEEILAGVSVDDAVEDAGRGVRIEPVADELGRRPLEAVGDGFPRFYSFETPCSAEGYNDFCRLLPEGGSL